MKKRIFSILLAALMLLTLVPVTALATVDVNWGFLSKAMSGTEQASVTDVIKIEEDTPTTGVRTITLLTDITAGDEDTYLTVPRLGKSIVLNLNGHTLNRGLSGKTAAADGCVIIVDGTLTVMDEVGGGVITGGSKDGTGGGVFVSDSGVFTMNGGTISGNMATGCGGGIYVKKDGRFTMNGGTISGNTADNGGGGVMVDQNATFIMAGEKSLITDNETEDGGGGVFLSTGATFTMEDGSINNNTATKAGGGVYVYQGSFTMKNGMITGNKALGDVAYIEYDNNGAGGGVYVDDMSTVNLLSGRIVKNHAATFAGGVGCNCPITVGGTIVVNGNTASSTDLKTSVADNVNLRDLRAVKKQKENFATEYKVPYIQISTETDLQNSAKIGVTLESGEGTVVKKDLKKVTAKCFVADNNSTELVYDKNTGSLTMRKDNSILSKVTTLLAVAVSTTIAVRSITQTAKMVVGIPMALAVAPQVLRVLSRFVFFPRFF